jgi:hypothetical protein
MFFNAEFTRNGGREPQGRAQKPAVNHACAPFIENKRYA